MAAKTYGLYSCSGIGMDIRRVLATVSKLENNFVTKKPGLFGRERLSKRLDKQYCVVFLFEKINNHIGVKQEPQANHAKRTKLTVEEFYHERAPLVLPQTSRTCRQKSLAFHT